MSWSTEYSLWIVGSTPVHAPEGCCCGTPEHRFEGVMSMEGLDPIMFEVIRNALTSATEEMALTLRLSAYSTNIKTRADFSCAFFDADLRSVAQAFAQPSHLGSLTR